MNLKFWQWWDCSIVCNKLNCSYFRENKTGITNEYYWGRKGNLDNPWSHYLQLLIFKPLFLSPTPPPPKKIGRNFFLLLEHYSNEHTSLNLILFLFVFILIGSLNNPSNPETLESVDWFLTPICYKCNNISMGHYGLESRVECNASDEFQWFNDQRLHL